MPAKHQPVRKLSVRVSEAQLRRFKSCAAARGKSLQTAVTEAVDRWMAQPEQKHNGIDPAFLALRGILAGPEFDEILREDERIEREHERRLDELAGLKPR